MPNRTLGITAVTLSFAALPAGADEGRIPIANAPTVLAAPGKYFVTKNLAPAAGSAITIASDNVDIDLNGFTLTSGDFAPVITAIGMSGVTIRNGTMVGGGPNVMILGATRVVIEDVQAIGGGGFNTAVGIQLRDSTQIAVRRAVVRDTDQYAIEIRGFRDAVGAITDSLIEDCGGGISVDSAGPSSVAIVNNRLKNIDGNGLFHNGTGCLIAGNTFDGIASSGMVLSTKRCTIRDNVVSGAGGSGIQLQFANDNLILNNVVGNAVGAGFGIGGLRNNIEGNMANLNGSFGFLIDGNANLYRRNMARGNAGVAGGFCAGACSPDLCVIVPAAGTSAGDNFLPGPPAFALCI